jgi:hypothetical protein
VSSDLRKRSYQTLLYGAREASPSVSYDGIGYAGNWEENMADGLPLGAIISDLSAGAGSELNGKLRAAHSSAALAVNTFGPWRTDPANLQIGGVSRFSALKFEATCPTGLGGTPPHLDLIAEGELPIAVESKCTEWMEAKAAHFSASYDKLRSSHGSSPWFEQIQQLRDQPNRYSFLDAAQLVKHALGLTSMYGSRSVQLVYLYWEPNNAQSWAECRSHRSEAEDLALRVAGSNIRLIPMSYRDLWTEWETVQPPPHLTYLRARYDRLA